MLFVDPQMLVTTDRVSPHADSEKINVLGRQRVSI